MSEILGFLRSAIARVCDIDPGDVQHDTALRDLGLDSLNLFRIIEQVEAEFMIALTPEARLALFEAERVEEIARVLSTVRANVELAR